MRFIDYVSRAKDIEARADGLSYVCHADQQTLYFQAPMSKGLNGFYLNLRTMQFDPYNSRMPSNVRSVEYSFSKRNENLREIEFFIAEETEIGDITRVFNFQLDKGLRWLHSPKIRSYVAWAYVDCRVVLENGLVTVEIYTPDHLQKRVCRSLKGDLSTFKETLKRFQSNRLMNLY